MAATASVITVPIRVNHGQATLTAVCDVSPTMKKKDASMPATTGRELPGGPHTARISPPNMAPLVSPDSVMAR